MGMFGFFKGKKSIEPEVGSMTFDKVKDWIGDKEVELMKNDGETLDVIKERLDGFYISIDLKLGVLEGIDIEARKENERAKILVRQGLNKYINSVRVLLKEMDGIRKDRLENFAKELVDVFNRFEKGSALFYGRANYLIGDEMAAVRNEARSFYNELVGVFEKSTINDLKKVEVIKLKLKEFEKFGNSYREIKEDILEKDKMIDESDKKVKNFEDEIEEIKRGSEYTSGMDAREKIKKMKMKMNAEVSNLKNMIDFKRLTNIVHSNERELGIVKSYRAHFAEEFSRDKGEKLFTLMSESNMKSVEVDAQIELIEKRRWELVEKHETIGRDYTVIRTEEITKIKEEKENIELENVKEDRRLEELKLRLKGLKNEIILLTEGLGVKIV